MANNFEAIKELTTGKNTMTLTNAIMRAYGIPLDYSSVQESYEKALEYAKTNAKAYIGQPISVGDKLYIVTDEANGYLKEVGSKPVGDDKSISVAEDGTVSIRGFAAAGTATLPRKKADGTIEWVAINQIVANDRNTVTTLQVAEGSALTITPTEDAYDADNDTYNYVLDVTLPAIPEYSITKEVGTDKVTYKLTKDGTAVGDAIEVHNAYDDTALAGRVSSAEAGISALDSRVSDVEETVNEFFAAVENPDEVIDTLAEIQKYITDDKTGAAGMAASIKANADALEVLNGTSANSVKGKIDAAIAAQAATDAGKYALNADLSAVSAKADAAAVKTEVEAALANKADKSDLEDLDNYYNKTQIDNFLSGIRGEYGETADSVAAELNVHKAENASAFASITEKNNAQDTAIQTNTDAIAAINDETNGIYARAVASAATTAESKVTALAETTVKQNTANISALNSTVEGIQGTVNTVSGRVGTLETKVGTLETDLAAEVGSRTELGKTVAQHTIDISGLKDEDGRLNAAIAAANSKFDSYSTTAQVEGMIEDAIDAIEYTDLETDIASNTRAISDEATRAKAREDEIAAIANQNATDIGKANANIAALDAAIKAVIDDEDGTTLNSIKDLAVWVEEHETEVLPAIKANTEAIALLNDKTGKEGSIQKIVADAIAGIPATPIATSTVAGIVKASAEVTVGGDGTMGIGVVSTDKLVQGSATLVLSGGNAGVTA